MECDIYIDSKWQISWEEKKISWGEKKIFWENQEGPPSGVAQGRLYWHWGKSFWDGIAWSEIKERDTDLRSDISAGVGEWDN